MLQANRLNLHNTSMQENQQHDSVNVFVGVYVGKGHHHAVALDRTGKRPYNKALPNDETKLRCRWQSPATKVFWSPICRVWPCAASPICMRAKPRPTPAMSHH
jgi:hypothetical protein